MSSHTRVPMYDHPRVQRTRRHQTHREDVMRAGKGMCHICGQGGADAIDHVVPVAWGGSDHPSNLAPAHTSCNSRKRDARPDAWTWRRPDMWIDGYGPHATMGLRKPTSRLGFGFGWMVGLLIIALPVATTVRGSFGSFWVWVAVAVAIRMLSVVIPHAVYGSKVARLGRPIKEEMIDA